MEGMENAADKLGAIVDKWAAQGVSNSSDSVIIRGGGKNLDDPALWEDFSEAVRQMIQIEDFIAANPRFEKRQRPLIAALWRHVVQPAKIWEHNSANTSTGGREKLGAITRGGLETLASAMDLHQSLPMMFTPVEKDTLREALLEIRNGVWMSDEIAPELKEYLDELVTQCIDVLDGDDPDLTVAADLAFQIVGVAVAVGDEIPEKATAKFLGALRKVAGVLRKGVVSAAVSRGSNSAIDGGLEIVKGLLEGSN